MLNIYSKCYYAKATNSSKKYKFTQSGRKLDLADFVDCDDHAGIDNYLNDPITQAELHVDPIRYEICNDDVANNYHVG